MERSELCKYVNVRKEVLVPNDMAPFIIMFRINLNIFLVTGNLKMAGFCFVFLVCLQFAKGIFVSIQK